MLADLVSGTRVQEGWITEQRVARIATAFSSVGLTRGAVISVLMRNDFPFLEILLAAERVGIIAVPLNWHARPEDTGFILDDSGSAALFGHSDLINEVRPWVPERCKIVKILPPPEIRSTYHLSEAKDDEASEDLDYEDWLAAAEPFSGASASPPYRLFYTSGTTGRPKGVKRLAGSAELGARAAERVRKAHGLNLTPIRALMTGPLYHSAPNVYAINCMKFGEILVLQPRFDAEQALRLIEAHRLSHLHAVPTMFSRLLDLPEERRARFDPSCLKAVVHGAAMCPADVKRAMIDWWGPVLLEYYAATEVGIVTAATSQEWLAHPGTVGRPPSGVEIRIVGSNGEALPVGEIGEITIASDVASLVSYLHLPEETAELRCGDRVTLGDIGYQNADGYLWLCDRKKDMVIIGGVNVFPAEIEAVIGRQDGVFDCSVFGIADRDLGESLVAVVQADPGATLGQADIQAAVHRELGRLKVPKIVSFVDALPRDDSGKVARRKLRGAFLAIESDA